MTAPVYYPNASIVIVDESLILLEIAVSSPDGHVRVQGDLVFHDPDAVLAGPLRDLFSNIANGATLVTTVT